MTYGECDRHFSDFTDTLSVTEASDQAPPAKNAPESLHRYQDWYARVLPQPVCKEVESREGGHINRKRLRAHCASGLSEKEVRKQEGLDASKSTLRVSLSEGGSKTGRPRCRRSKTQRDVRMHAILHLSAVHVLPWRPSQR